MRKVKIKKRSTLKASSGHRACNLPQKIIYPRAFVVTKRNSNVAHFLRGLGILQTTAVAVARVPKYREKLKGNSSYGIYISIKKKKKERRGKSISARDLDRKKRM